MSIAGQGERKRHREEERERRRREGGSRRKHGEWATSRPAEDACCF